MQIIGLSDQIKRTIAQYFFRIAYSLEYFDIAKEILNRSIKLEILLEDGCANSCYNETILVYFNGVWNLDSDFEDHHSQFQTEVGCKSQLEQLITRICQNCKISRLYKMSLGMRIPVKNDSNDYFHVVIPDKQFSLVDCHQAIQSLMNIYIESIDNALTMRQWQEGKLTYFWSFERNPDYITLICKQNNIVQYYQLLTCFRLNENLEENEISMEQIIWKSYSKTDIPKEMVFQMKPLKKNKTTLHKYSLDKVLSYFNSK